MIPEEQLQEIRDYLEKAENPLFFFDDDPDGLASYLVLKKKYDKGHGICVKASPHEESIYTRKREEYHPDLVIILDRAIISQELINSMHVPLIWLDHHEPLDRKGVHYYNPLLHKPKDNNPTSYWTYKVVNDFEWIAMVGMISDWYVPNFASSFKYKELFDNQTTPGEILFESRFGMLAKVFHFMLKSTTSEVNEAIVTLAKIEDPYEILNQSTPKGKFIYKKYEKINKIYEELLQQALQEVGKEDIFLFICPPAKISLSRVLSTELGYRIKKKLVIVARESEGCYKISLRSKVIKVLPLLKKALLGINGYGGGHEYACGANVKKEDFNTFLNNLKNEM